MNTKISRLGRGFSCYLYVFYFVCVLCVFPGSCLVNVRSTSCSASAWCCCSSLCSGCSSAVRVTCTKTGVPPSSRHRRRNHGLQWTTRPGVLTNWPSSSLSENASRSCWSLFPSCTRSSTRRRSATRSSSSTSWITTGEEVPSPGVNLQRRLSALKISLHLFICFITVILFFNITKPHPANSNMWPTCCLCLFSV